MLRFLATVLALFLVLTPAMAQQRTQYVLAISWQPSFCERSSKRVECTTQTEDRFDASYFSLHGLWPQRVDYCSVQPGLERADKDGRWDALPVPEMTDVTRQKLSLMMPGAASLLDRHEWIKHGTCYGEPPDAYFTHSLRLLDAVNASAVRELFAANIGKELTREQVRAAFDTAFGAGAGERVRIACLRDGDRRLIVELTIGLTGQINVGGDLPRLMMAARPTDGGCDAGIVDAVGLQ